MRGNYEEEVSSCSGSYDRTVFYDRMCDNSRRCRNWRKWSNQPDYDRWLYGVMYFVAIRPQKKEQKKQSQMLSALEVGDIVLTTSGFYGTVIDITDDTVIVEFGNNKNCRIPMQKSAIVEAEKPDAE